jgi:outer membrane lipoprotein-sorting protein
MKLIKFLLFFLLPTLVIGQNYTPVKDTVAFNKKVVAMGNITASLESDFTQVKSLKMMKDKVVSKGKLYFKKNDMLRWEYTSPFSYIIVLNKNKISIKNNGKVKRYDIEKNKVFKEINDILLSCVQGTILRSGKFAVSSFENASGYKIELIPKKEAMKNTLSKITLYLDVKVSSVVKMEMSEPSGDFTTISFSSKKINGHIGDDIFQLK